MNESNGKPKIKIYQDHGVSKGECTISFVNEADAQKVVATMNGQLKNLMNKINIHPLGQTFPGTESVMQISMAQFKDNSGGSASRSNDRGSGRGGNILPIFNDYFQVVFETTTEEVVFETMTDAILVAIEAEDAKMAVDFEEDEEVSYRLNKRGITFGESPKSSSFTTNNSILGGGFRNDDRRDSGGYRGRGNDDRGGRGGE